MTIHESDGIVSRRWPITIKNYWFGQRPMKHALPDIARLHSIPEPLNGAINVESWTLLIDLTGTDSDLTALLDRDTRKQVKRAELEGISVERYDSNLSNILNDFFMFYNNFSESKPEVRDILNISVQLHMLKRIADSGMLKVTRTVGRDGEPLVYRVYIAADGRVRGLHSASLFREGQGSKRRHYLGRANRYLHFQNMLYFKHRGYSQYDLGGWYCGKDNESLLRINRFKEAFGGRVVREYDAMIGRSYMGNLALRARDWLHNILNRKLFRD